MKLDNGTHKAEVHATGNSQTVKVSGCHYRYVSRDLDLAQADSFEPVPIMLRLTHKIVLLVKAKLYMREIIEDDLASTNYLEVTGSAGSTKKIQWGNDDGTILWNNVYCTNMGSFSPDELSTSAFVSDSLIRMGLSVVDLLQNSKRFFIKNLVDDSSILYGYDISSQQISRIAPPSIHVILTKNGFA